MESLGDGHEMWDSVGLQFLKAHKIINSFFIFLSYGPVHYARRKVGQICPNHVARPWPTKMDEREEMMGPTATCNQLQRKN